jgi:hypothetical protein
MALVIMGGLAISTFLTLVLLPTTTTLVEDSLALLRRLIVRAAAVSPGRSPASSRPRLLPTPSPRLGLSSGR